MVHWLYTEHSASSVTLRWAQNDDPDSKGYIVERSNSIAGIYTPVHDGLLANTIYVDKLVSDTMTYYYRMKTINKQDREASVSHVVSVQPGDLNSDSDENSIEGEVR